MGNERIFISEEDFQLQDVEIHPVTASWDLDDYRLIVEAFTKLVLDDTIENWSLTQISLLLDCTNLNSIEDAILTYYKIDKSATKPSRYVYKYSIKPNTGLFRVVKDEYYPVGNLFRPIEPSMIEIPLDVLIRVAEQNGGAETRIQELNNCEIIVTQNPQLLEYTGWVVAYTTERGERLNVFYINPETGELESGR
jgi:hypothetical protein